MLPLLIYFYCFFRLYEQCISIFPRPSISDEGELDKQLDLLARLYAEVDRHAIGYLEKLVPSMGKKLR